LSKKTKGFFILQLRSAHLALLEDDTMSYSLQKYVEGDPQAIREAVAETLRTRQAAAEQSRATSKEQLLDVIEKEVRTQIHSSPALLFMFIVNCFLQREARRSVAPDPRSRKREQDIESDLQATARAFGAEVAASSSARTSKARKPRGKKAQDSEEEEEYNDARYGEEEEDEYKPSDDDDELMDMSNIRLQRAARGVGAARGRLMSDDEENEDDDEEVVPRSRARAAPSAAKPARKPATKKPSVYEQESILEEDALGGASDEDFAPKKGAAASRGRGRGGASRGGVASTIKAPRGRGTATASAAASAAKRARPIFESDEDVVLIDSDEEPPAKAPAAKQAKLAPAPVAAKTSVVPDSKRSVSSARKLPWDM
jgi:hypothetical protein